MAKKKSPKTANTSSGKARENASVQRGKDRESPSPDGDEDRESEPELDDEDSEEDPEAEPASTDSDEDRESEPELDDEDSDEDPEDREEQDRPPPKKADRSRSKPAAAVEPSSSTGPAKPRGASSSAPRLSWGEGAALAVVALIVGAVVGWYGRSVHSGTAGPDLGASAPVALPVGSAAPGSSGAAAQCKFWSEQICAGAGNDSEGCAQAKSAANLLSDEACRTALAQVPATIERLKQARSSCDDLVARLCKDIGPETDSCKMVRERTPQFPTSRCEQLLGQYDSVLAELQQMERQNAPLSAEQAARLAAADAPSAGPKDAKVVVVVYSDFECPHCAGMTQTIEKIREKYGKAVRIVFRNFPLSFHKKARLAAEAALAAHTQGKFWSYHDRLFANQDKLDRADLEDHASKLGLDLAAFRAALDGDEVKARVAADLKLAEEIGIGGTPTMIIDTERVPNPRDFDEIVEQIDKRLAAADAPAEP